jgi:hypothetical protein
MRGRLRLATGSAFSALILSVVGVFGAAAGGADLDPPKANLPFARCGHEQIEGYRYWSVQSYNMGCKNARAVADRFTHAHDRTPQGFSCKSRVIKDGVMKHRCDRGSGMVVPLRPSQARGKDCGSGDCLKVVKFKTGVLGPRK